jgi:hypothetical protein
MRNRTARGRNKARMDMEIRRAMCARQKSTEKEISLPAVHDSATALCAKLPSAKSREQNVYATEFRGALRCAGGRFNI